MRTWVVILSVFACVLGILSQAVGDSIPRQPMPEKVYQALREALESYPFPEGERDEQVKQNLQGLEKLRTVLWPDLDKLQWVSVHHRSAKTTFFKTWGLPERQDASELSNQELALLMPDLTARQLPEGAFSKVEILNYGDDLAELVKAIQDGSLVEKRRSLLGVNWVYDIERPDENLDLLLLRHAYAAAYLGKDKEAETLVHEALSQNEIFFKKSYDKAVWRAFSRGMRLLQGGKPWADVLAQWDSTLNVYSQSRYRDQLLGLVEPLKKQVEEEEKLAAHTLETLRGLTVQQRINYCIARFPEVRGSRWMSPGRCRVLGSRGGPMGGPTWFSDHIVTIGRPAVPKLIEHLADRRLTRSVSSGRFRQVVLRAQDVALSCIEKIIEIDFYRPFSTLSYLSNEKPEVREKVIEEIKSWWKEYGHKTPLEGHLARLEHRELRERLKALKKIEQMDGGAIDSIKVLKRWAEEAEERQLPRLANELARRGDLSLLPAMREMIRARNRRGLKDPQMSYPLHEMSYALHECVWFVLKHGSAEDYRFLRQAARKDIEAGAKLGTTNFIYGVVNVGVANSENPLAVPILVDFLDRREITGGRVLAGMKENTSMGFSCADTCMATLIRLTGHDEGYNPIEPVEEKRYAAIDRWIAWWEKEGQAAYVKEHPEVLKVLEESSEADSPD